MIKSWKPVCLLWLLLSCTTLGAQQRVLQFEGFINDITHRGFLINSKKTNCDSLNLRTWQNKAPGEGEILCFLNEFEKDQDFVFYDRDGISLCMKPDGSLYAIDVGKPGKQFDLKMNLFQKAGNRKNIVLEPDDSSPDSLRMYLVPLENYRLGTRKYKDAIVISISYDEYVFSTKGILSPAILADIAARVTMDPENGVSTDSIIFYIPVHLANVPGNFSFIIYDLGGNVIKMYTGVKHKQFVLQKENLASGTYYYKIFFADTTEITTGRFHFKPIPRPE